MSYLEAISFSVWKYTYGKNRRSRNRADADVCRIILMYFSLLIERLGCTKVKREALDYVLCLMYTHSYRFNTNPTLQNPLHFPHSSPIPASQQDSRFFVSLVLKERKQKRMEEQITNTKIPIIKIISDLGFSQINLCLKFLPLYISLTWIN